MSSISPETIYEIEARIRSETGKWLLGLEDPIKLLVRSLFVLIPYTDKVTGIKSLGQPNVQFSSRTGIGKTDMIESLSMCINAKSSRIQGTPDLQPQDFIGDYAFAENARGDRTLKFVPGKIFAHIVKIDEANRARPQAKAGLLEALEEHSITPPHEHVDIGDNSDRMFQKMPLFPVSGKYDDFDGPRFFMTLSTQNIYGEEEGAYDSPMAEIDRTSLVIPIRRPSFEKEMLITSNNVVGKKIQKVTDLYEILKAAQFIHDNVKIHDRAMEYRTRLIRNTDPEALTDDVGRGLKVNSELLEYVTSHIEVGVSPRVEFHLEAVARVYAFFDGSMVVKPEHFIAVAPYVLAHRIKLLPKKARKIRREEAFNYILKETEVPPWPK